MGGCLGCSQTEGDIKNTQLSKELEREKKEFNKVKKILFLGSGGSGKSTIFKQLRGIYGEGFTQNERKTFVDHIHEQCLTQMKLALEVLEDYMNGDMDGILKQNERAYVDHDSADSKDTDDTDDDDDDDFDEDIPELSEQAIAAKEYLQNIHYTHYKLNDENVAALKCLWNEPAIKKMYEMRNITKIEDSSAYFWDKLDALSRPNYVPDEADILLVRYRTTGATEEKYEMPDNKGSFSIIDVGGQKSERKKWIKCFEGVTAVIFVASLSCYDEVLFEDYSTNSMTDQLQLFDDICNNDALKETSMILFLNKKDLFAEKIKRVPLNKCESLSEYTGSATSFDQTTKYIRKAFTSLNNEPNKKNIFTHITCATDQDNISKVFADVQHIVIEASLISAGLMDWDDNQRYRSIDSTNHREESMYNDPETARKIRETIHASNKQKSLYVGSAFPNIMHSISTTSPNYTNFREVIKQKSVPQLDSVQYAMILPQYKYDINKNSIAVHKLDDNELVSCKYCWAQSSLPSKVFGNKSSSQQNKETYMILDVEPNISIQSQINRKKINLIIVLDIGKNMDKEFTDGRNKMDVTKECIIDVIRKLNGDDRFGLITFDSYAKVIQDIELKSNLNINQLCNTIQKDIESNHQSMASARVGSTGFQFAVSQYRKLWTQKKITTEYENRIIMITTTRLVDKTISDAKDVATDSNIQKRVYSTFIGISNRFSLQKRDMSAIRGCNYFSIHSSEQLSDKMVSRFDDIVTPLMYDMELILKSQSSDELPIIDSVYRLNNDFYDEDYRYSKKRDKGRILHISTLFLTKQKYAEDDDNRINNCNLLLVKLSSQLSNVDDLQLMLRFTNQSGRTIQNTKSIPLQRTQNEDGDEEENKEDALLKNGSSSYNNYGGYGGNNDDYYDNNAIRKAILLSRYIRILREYVKSNKPQKGGGNSPKNGYSSSKFKEFANYFQSEANFINDDILDQEKSVLHALFK